jgi:Fe-S oxidoreductase
MGIDNKLTSTQKHVVKSFKNMLDGRLYTHLNSCVHCGLCGESCHYYLSTHDLRYLPGNKVKQIASVYKRYFTFLGRLIPGWVGAKDLNNETIDEMVDVIFGGCTMCGRCTIHCSIGVDVPYLVHTARSLLVELEMVPAGLQSTIDAALQTGNNMAIPKEELVDTLKWLEEDLRMDLNDENASIPLDVKGKHLLYTLNPREPKFFPLSISAIAKIFHYAEEDWTISTNCYDVTNYAYYSGDNIAARELVQRLYDETIKLDADTLVLAECGHGFRAMRWEGPRLIKKAYPFDVKSVIEIIGEYIHSGKIILDPKKNKKPVTIHDPCNLVRAGGIIEIQRFVLSSAVETFVEMTPNRENNYCCVGGGGQLSMGDYKSRRIGSGRIKADQIRKTGAKIVATPCHNCIDQLMELNKEYELGVEIKTIAEIVADAIV